MSDDRRETLRRDLDIKMETDVRQLAIEVRKLTELVASHGVRLAIHMEQENDTLHRFMDSVTDRLGRIEQMIAGARR